MPFQAPCDDKKEKPGVSWDRNIVDNNHQAISEI